MVNKKVLFVGDLRSANNYGAIMTTECLMDLVENEVGRNNVKYIDRRSFQGKTPTGGWQKSEPINSRLKRFVRDYVPFSKTIYSYVEKINNRIYRFHVPVKLEEYDTFSQKVMDGKALQYELNLIKWADIVYINSEGNIVNGTDEYGRYRKGGLYVLFIAYFAKKYMNKKVCIVNHTVDPANRDVIDIIKKVYPMLDFISVREKLSYKKLKELGIDNIDFVPDALFSYHSEKNAGVSENAKSGIDFSKPYICIGDSSAIKSAYSAVKWDVANTYLRLIRGLQKIVPQIVFVDGFSGSNEKINRVIKKAGIKSVSLVNCNYHQLYNLLSNAELFISGRWHASILCLLGNTPILLWGADSHKTLSLYDLFDYPYRFFEVKALPIHIDDICEEARKILHDKEEVQKLINTKVNGYRSMVYRNTEILRKL